MISEVKPTTYIHEFQLNTDDNAPGQNTISKMIRGTKPTTYIHETQMNTDYNAPGQKHEFKND
jgi:hypothetical protein